MSNYNSEQPLNLPCCLQVLTDPTANTAQNVDSQRHQKCQSRSCLKCQCNSHFTFTDLAMLAGGIFLGTFIGVRLALCNHPSSSNKFN